MKNRVFILLTAIVLALVLTVSVLANDGNLGDTDGGYKDEWIGDADGLIDGTDGAEQDSGLMGEITDRLMGGDTGNDRGGRTGDSGTGSADGSDMLGGGTGDTGSVTGDPGTGSGSASVDGTGDDGMSVFGVVIVILIILAVIALVIVLMPKRK